MVQKKVDQGGPYQIKVKESMDGSLADWFGDIVVLPQENGETLILGEFPDQAALRGFLDQLWNLNFSVLSVERLMPQEDEPN